MKLILFSKMLKDRSIDELADLAAVLGIDGYDLAVRPGHPVNPDNVAEALPRAAATRRARGFDIPMITASTDLVEAAATGCGTWLAAVGAAPRGRVSGSAATCFALHGREADAEAQAGRLRRSRPNWWVVAAPVAPAMPRA